MRIAGAIYISGPMTGLLNLNAPAFREAEDWLKMWHPGARIFNPYDVTLEGETWEDAMRWDIAMLMRCEIVYMLQGWESSKGAVMERSIATQLGMKVIYQ